jgi:beta-phosphoglucomutase-like phosphatase (HAD superfamily)
LTIKAAIFDMDGTLVDSLMLWSVLWSKFGERYLQNENFTPSVEDDKKVRTLTLKEAMNLIHNNYRLGESGEELLALANHIMADFYTNTVELKPGVREYLEYCKNSGVKMCLATATAPELLNLAIKHCDIERYFLKIFSCTDLGKGKEEPDIFLLAS